MFLICYFREFFMFLSKFSFHGPIMVYYLLKSDFCRKLQRRRGVLKTCWTLWLFAIIKNRMAIMLICKTWTKRKSKFHKLTAKNSVSHHDLVHCLEVQLCSCSVLQLVTSTVLQHIKLKKLGLLEFFGFRESFRWYAKHIMNCYQL